MAFFMLWRDPCSIQEKASHMKSRQVPSIQSGPMADIAFLLLIFFLVTTTINAEKGIWRKLPEISETPSIEHHQRNSLLIRINSNDEILVNDADEKISDLRQTVKDFVNNDGSGTCDYCSGSRHLPASSDHPQKAWVVIEHNRGTSYATYVAIQNEVTAAYNELREEQAQNHYGKIFKDLKPELQKVIIARFPLLLSEAQPDLE